MGIAIVRMNWRPEDFWRATPHEFWSAIEVFEEQQRNSRGG